MPLAFGVSLDVRLFRAFMALGPKGDARQPASDDDDDICQSLKLFYMRHY